MVDSIGDDRITDLMTISSGKETRKSYYVSDDIVAHTTIIPYMWIITDNSHFPISDGIRWCAKAVQTAKLMLWPKHGTWDYSISVTTFTLFTALSVTISGLTLIPQLCFV